MSSRVIFVFGEAIPTAISEPFVAPSACIQYSCSVVFSLRNLRGTCYLSVYLKLFSTERLPIVVITPLGGIFRNILFRE